MPEVALHSPLVGISRLGPRVLSADAQSCTLTEIPFVEMLNLRGNAQQPAWAQAVQHSTGLPLPAQPNTYQHNAQRQLLWLGPDEWLLTLRDGQGSSVAQALCAATAGQHCAVVAVGDGHTTLDLQGPGAATLLARGCPLDLHPRAFAAGAMAQTHIAKANATVLCMQPGEHFQIIVRRSFADYLFRWLCEAGS